MAKFDVNQRQLVVAMDHGRAMGAVESAKAGCDAIMTSFGVIKRYRDRLIGGSRPSCGSTAAPASIARTGCATPSGACCTRSRMRRSSGRRHLHDGLVGADCELETLEITAELAGQCFAAGLPLMVEALPCPCERIPDPTSADAMASACRIGFEHGADMVKTYAPGGVEAFRQVTASTPVPVLIAGGPKAGGPREALQVVRDSLDGGGRGVVFGRNIWQSPDPARMVAALRHLIHADGSVDEALQVLG